jgi:uncharacterized protein (DUF1778 family)
MKLTKQKLYNLIQEAFELNNEQENKLVNLLSSDIEGAQQALELIDSLDIGYKRMGLLGNALQIANAGGHKKRHILDFLQEIVSEMFMLNLSQQSSNPKEKEQGMIRALSINMETAKEAINLMDKSNLSVEDQMFVLNAALKNAKKYDIIALINDKLNELADEQDFGL